MATTLRGTGWGGASTNTSELLTAYINEPIRVLEPELKYATLGLRKDIPKGNDRLLFPQTNQLPVKINTSMLTVGGNGGFAGGGSVFGAGASILGDATTAPGAPVSSTFGVAALVEGTNPTSVTWGATAYVSGPGQYGILVAVSDLLVRNSAIEVIDDASMQVRNALARLVDTVLQNVVNAGTNGVIYAGGKTTRATIGAGDTIAQSDITRGTAWLRSSNAAGLSPFAGAYYVGIISPAVANDLSNNTASGSWVDMARYSDVQSVKEGKLGDFRGVRFMNYAYQNYYNSTVAVSPVTLLGERSFGWGYFQQPEAILVTTADSNNPLNLFKSIAGKVTLGATRFEDAVGYIRIVRIETAFTA